MLNCDQQQSMEDLSEVDKDTWDSIMSSSENISSSAMFDIDLDNEPDFTVTDKKAKCRAIATLPDVLYIKNSGKVKKAVFAKKEIPARTRFGPVDAPLTTKDNLSPCSFLLKLKKMVIGTSTSNKDEFAYYDLSNINFCNWTSLVQPASCFSHQNLCAHQVDDHIYFTSIKHIPANEELKVWYSVLYASFIGLPVLQQSPKRQVTQQIVVTNDLESISSDNSKAIRQMQAYLETLNTERKERSVPPKKRGWKQSNKEIQMKDTNNDILPDSSEQSAIVSKIKDRKSNSKIGKRCNKEVKCTICGKGFYRLDKFRLHLLVHSDVRSYLCQYCGNTYKRIDKLTEHIKKKHMETLVSIQEPSSSTKIASEEPEELSHLDGFPYKCKTCKIGFRRRGMYLNHILKRHPNIKIGDLPELTMPILKHVRDFLCPHCEKVYKSVTKRKNHILKKHPGKAIPPSIRTVLKANPTTTTINQEASIEAGQVIEVEPVKCMYCEKQYSSKGKLNKHVSDKHSEMVSGTGLFESMQKTAKDSANSNFSFQSNNNNVPQSSIAGQYTSYQKNDSVNSMSRFNYPPKSGLGTTHIGQNSNVHMMNQPIPNQTFLTCNTTQASENSMLFTGQSPSKFTSTHHVHPRKQMIHALDQENNRNRASSQQFYANSHSQSQPNFNSDKQFIQHDFSIPVPLINVNNKNNHHAPHRSEYSNIIAQDYNGGVQNEVIATNIAVSTTPASDTESSKVQIPDIPEDPSTHHQLMQTVQALLETDGHLDSNGIVNLQSEHDTTNQQNSTDWLSPYDSIVPVPYDSNKANNGNNEYNMTLPDSTTKVTSVDLP